MLLLLQDIADKNCKSFLSDTLFCIIDNKKISIELKEGILMAVISEKSVNSEAFTRMTLPLLSDTAPKLSAG